jgi:spermidine synthase
VAGPRLTAIAGLYLLSGAGALLFEVCWMRALGLLFGVTSQAAAATLAAFFLGLAAGSAFWSRAAARTPHPLRLYGGLELAAALTASLYFFLPDAYRLIYPWLFERWQADFAWLLAAKFVLALAALFPAAFFMGGTLPALSRVAAGRGISALYAANTLGAALGALAAGFWLPGWLGYGGSYAVAMALSATAGGLALALSAKQAPLPNLPEEPPLIPLSLRERAWVRGDKKSWPYLTATPQALALWSGLATLALQVLWTRMFAQVLQNSVYTFAAVLVVFLAGLAGGALLAHGLARLRRPLAGDLFLLLCAAGFTVAATPSWFVQASDGLQYLGAGLDWPAYVLAVLGLVAQVLAPALLCMGALFPRLLDGLRQDSETAQAIGRLSAANTLGAIAGALLGGFVLLAWLGLWAGIQAIALLYLLAALLLAWRQGWRMRVWQTAALSLLVYAGFGVADLPPLHLATDERLLWLREDAAATVAVVEKNNGQRRIKVNNNYTLGGTGSRRHEALQGYLPVRLHPQPEQVFFLGLGTGISAGGALPAGAGQITVAELLPGAVAAAQGYFAAYQHGLWQTPAVHIVPDDGRNLLAASRTAYDVIVADLFIPWEAGAGNLYSLEHFQAVRAHLRDGGLFMQWLPAYQLTPESFAAIVHTLQRVFPETSLWRDDFAADRPVLGLLASAKPQPWANLAEKPRLFGQDDNVPLLARLVADDSALRRLAADAPVYRDDRPLLEWQAPIAQRQEKTGQAHWLTGNSLLSLLDRLYADSAHATLPPPLRHFPETGYRLHRAQLLQADGYLSAAETELARYRQLANQP